MASAIYGSRTSVRGFSLELTAGMCAFLEVDVLGLDLIGRLQLHGPEICSGPWRPGSLFRPPGPSYEKASLGALV
jgi:hypothetical protein